MKPRDRPALTAQEFRDDPLRLPAGAALVRAGCRSGRPLPRRPSLYDNAALSDSCPLMPAPGQESGMNRRQFLVASSLGFAGLTFGQPVRSARGENEASAAGTARSTILFFLCGGASHLDMWDMKPDAPAEYRGPFQPIATIRARRAAVRASAAAGQAGASSGPGQLRSARRVNTNDHHAGYYYNLTGHVPDQTFLTLGNNRTPYRRRLAVHGHCRRCASGRRTRTCRTRSRCRTSQARRRTRGPDSSPPGSASSTIRSMCTAAWRSR